MTLKKVQFYRQMASDAAEVIRAHVRILCDVTTYDDVVFRLFFDGFRPHYVKKKYPQHGELIKTLLSTVKAIFFTVEDVGLVYSQVAVTLKGKSTKWGNDRETAYDAVPADIVNASRTAHSVTRYIYPRRGKCPHCRGKGKTPRVRI